jgi:hypothetical protein
MIGIVDLILAGAIGHPSADSGLASAFSNRPRTQNVSLAMLQAIGSSSNTLLMLSDEPGLQSRDCFSVCRSIVELAVNICYIYAKGETAAEQAERHAYQKAFRDLSRESSVGDQTIRLRFMTEETIQPPPGLLKSIDEFTSRSGREKGWTDLSIDARCEKVGQILGNQVLTPLHWARFAVYRHSSEILHGTFFSAAYFMGLTDPTGGPSNLDEWIDRIAGQHLMILLAAVLALIAVTKAVDAIFGARNLVTKANRYLDELKRVPFFTSRENTRK